MASACPKQNGHSTPKDTLFPKISGKHVDFLKGLQQLKEAGKLPVSIDVEGTIKLHGMHADIVYDLRNLDGDTSGSTGSITFQSRNRTCEATENQQGWPYDVAKYPDALLYLQKRILTRFGEKNPGTTIDKSCPLIIAGEWIGGKIQRQVGLAELTTRFVILSVQLNGTWLKDEDHADIQAPKAGIYSIFHGGQQKLQLDTENLDEMHPAPFEMQRLADTVEKACPYAAAFGVLNSRGEGVVWKPGTPEGRADPRYWLKTKGPISGPENRIDRNRIAADAARNTSVTEYAQRWVTPRRLEQGWEYLKELGIDANQKSLKEYINWVLHDVMVEERRDIETLKEQYVDVEQTVSSIVSRLARNVYVTELREYEKRSGDRLA